MKMHTIRGTLNLKTGRFTNSVDVVNQNDVRNFKKVFAEHSFNTEDPYTSEKDMMDDYMRTTPRKPVKPVTQEDLDDEKKDANYIARETIAALRDHKENPDVELDKPEPLIKEHYGFIDSCARIGRAWREEQKAKESSEQEAPKKQPTAADMMEKAGDTFRERGAVYGASYRIHGDVMKALFPLGVALNTVEDHQRFGVLTIMISKLCRYANQFARGGHEDSVHDLGVYSFILQELDNSSRIEETE